MRVLILGHSGTRSFGIPSEFNLVSGLKRGLGGRFPHETVEVYLRGWGYFSDERLKKLLAEIESRQPDYLLLDPAATWVTLPLLETPIRKLLPVRLRPLLGKALRLKTRVHGRVIGTAYGGPSVAIEDALSRLVKSVLPPDPLYSVNEVVGFFERLVCSIRHRQNPAIVVLGFLPYSPDLWWARRIPEFTTLLDRFRLGLADLCVRHGLQFVDLRPVLGSVLPPHDLLPDQIHLTSEATGRLAEAVCSVIAETESTRRRITG